MNSTNNKRIGVYIPGAGRSGTTTLFEYLAAHPQIGFTSLKEIHFFTLDDLYRRGEEYLHYFLPTLPEGGLYAGADTYAMTTHKAAARIAHYNMAMKLVFMLRHPVERALSGYRYAVYMGYLQQPKDWHQVLDQEEEVLAGKDVVSINNLCNAYQGLYNKHLMQWLKYFSREQMLLLTTRALNRAPNQVLAQLSSFLGIAPFTALEEGKRANAARSVRNKWLQQLLLNRNTPLRKLMRQAIPGPVKRKIIHSGFIDKMHQANTKPAANIDFPESFKSRLQEYYRKDLDALATNFGIHFD